MRGRFQRIALFAAVCSIGGMGLLAQGPGEASIDAPPAAGAYRLTAEFDRPGLSVPHWQIVVPLRGLAQYTGKPDKGTDPGTLSFAMTDAGRQKLGALLVRSKGLQPCETKSKGIANMGTKQVEYTPATGETAHCTFNYTDNKPLSDAFEYLQGIAGTVQVGVELERLHRFDRLGLDPVMTRLVEDVKNGRAVELGAIRPVLDSLLTDPLVLERVRTRAQQLLDLAKQEEQMQAKR